MEACAETSNIEEMTHGDPGKSGVGCFDFREDPAIVVVTVCSYTG